MENLKHLNISILFSAILLINTSCESKLYELPPSTLIAENAITDEATAETAVNGMYYYFGDYGELNAYSITTQSLRANLLEVNNVLRTDYEFQLSALQVEEDWNYLKNMWTDTFKLINAANNVISQLEKFNDSEFSPKKRQEFLGEAYFIRGYATLFQMKLFGHFWDIDSPYGPLLRTEPSGLNNNFKARSSVSEGYDQIIEDLTFASQFGPDYTTVFRASKNLAKAYLMETLLFRGGNSDFTQVITLADEIISSGIFALATDYSQVYSQGYNSSELMFSRQIREQNKDVSDLTSYTGSVYSVLGRNSNPANDNYYSYILPEDNRLPYIIGDTIASNGTPYNNTWIKHFNITGDVPMRFMRLTQIYLYKAEALARSGANVSEVLGIMNILRERAEMPLFDEVGIDPMDLQQLIFNEFLIEVGVENGSEYFAAIRLVDRNGKRIIETLNPAATTLNKLALPIPADELLFNPNITQNPKN